MDKPILPQSSPAQVEKFQRGRLRKDAFISWGVGLGGVSVLAVICLIFFYLAYVALPLFVSASIDEVAQYEGGELAKGKTFHIAINEHGTLGARFTETGNTQFFQLKDGKLIGQEQVQAQLSSPVTARVIGDAFSHILAYGSADGQVVLVQPKFTVKFDENDQRVITPTLTQLYEPISVHDGQPVTTFAVRDGEEQLTIASIVDAELHINRLSKEVSFLDDSVELDGTSYTVQLTQTDIQQLLIGPEQRWLYVLTHQGTILYYDISDPSEVAEPKSVVLETGHSVSSMQFLTGGLSLIINHDDGSLSQWFLVRSDQGQVLTKIRTLATDSDKLTAIAVEARRKGIIVGDDQGYIGLIHTTAESLVLHEQITEEAIRYVNVSPRASTLLTETTNGRFYLHTIHNEHPEVSWKSLWGKVWYESYSEPDYVWQSSSADNDFEPKLSLMPLSFGTLKAAFYAMLVAVPLAIFGAMYTAYFMAPKMRSYVKPTIEIMEALPTVVLGFLAGLWLAPLIELYMPAIFSLLIVLPIAVLLFGFMWQRLPDRIQHMVPEGWHALLLVPVILFVGYLAFALSHTFEIWFFGGDMRAWITNDLGINFDQRNALIIGIAMGFAVIPTIFSIAEDAIFSVPRHLTNGSLALGATTWHTMVHVILPTASPGIFSGVMMGFGRAVGETMIVLMATGNTPIMDFNIFEGMRTLAANIAVEMPEAEVASTHYRVLFLAALVLFLFTFVLNTIAELIRQRLRNKYGKI